VTKWSFHTDWFIKIVIQINSLSQLSHVFKMGTLISAGSHVWPKTRRTHIRLHFFVLRLTMSSLHNKRLQVMKSYLFKKNNAISNLFWFEDWQCLDWGGCWSHGKSWTKWKPFKLCHKKFFSITIFRREKISKKNVEWIFKWCRFRIQRWLN